MADSINSLLKQIRKAAAIRGIRFELHRKGKAHAIYHLGTSVVLPIPYSKVPARIKEEIYRQCEPELGHRWWMAADRKVVGRDDLPGDFGHGYRGPRG